MSGPALAFLFVQDAGQTYWNQAYVTEDGAMYINGGGGSIEGYGNAMPAFDVNSKIKMSYDGSGNLSFSFYGLTDISGYDLSGGISSLLYYGGWANTNIGEGYVDAGADGVADHLIGGGSKHKMVAGWDPLAFDDAWVIEVGFSSGNFNMNNGEPFALTLGTATPAVRIPDGAATPEPATLALFGLGITGLAAARRFRRK